MGVGGSSKHLKVQGAFRSNRYSRSQRFLAHVTSDESSKLAGKLPSFPDDATYILAKESLGIIQYIGKIHAIL